MLLKGCCKKIKRLTICNIAIIVPKIANVPTIWNMHSWLPIAVVHHFPRTRKYSNSITSKALIFTKSKEFDLTVQNCNTTVGFNRCLWVLSSWVDSLSPFMYPTTCSYIFSNSFTGEKITLAASNNHRYCVQRYYF